MSTPLPEQFCAGSAECLECDHTWAAVWILGCGPLQCPRCEGGDTVRAIGSAPANQPTTH